MIKDEESLLLAAPIENPPFSSCKKKEKRLKHNNSGR
jgi:hypothetical protein